MLVRVLNTPLLIVLKVLKRGSKNPLLWLVQFINLNQRKEKELLFLVLCFWYLHYVIFAFQQNRAFCTFSLLSRHELVLLEHLLFSFNIFMFLYDYHYHHYCYDIFHYYCFYFIFLSLFLLLLFLHTSSTSFCIYLCINRIFLNFKHMTWPNIVQSWQ